MEYFYVRIAVHAKIREKILSTRSIPQEIQANATLRLLIVSIMFSIWGQIRTPKTLVQVSKDLKIRIFHTLEEWFLNYNTWLADMLNKLPIDPTTRDRSPNIKCFKYPSLTPLLSSLFAHLIVTISTISPWCAQFITTMQMMTHKVHHEEILNYIVLLLLLYFFMSVIA